MLIARACSQIRHRTMRASLMLGGDATARLPQHSNRRSGPLLLAGRAYTYLLLLQLRPRAPTMVKVVAISLRRALALGAGVVGALLMRRRSNMQEAARVAAGAAAIRKFAALLRQGGGVPLQCIGKMHHKKNRDFLPRGLLCMETVRERQRPGSAERQQVAARLAKSHLDLAGLVMTEDAVAAITAPLLRRHKQCTRARQERTMHGTIRCTLSRKRAGRAPPPWSATI